MVVAVCEVTVHWKFAQVEVSKAGLTAAAPEDHVPRSEGTDVDVPVDGDGAAGFRLLAISHPPLPSARNTRNIRGA
jgi:hypothetical protein